MKKFWYVHNRAMGNPTFRHSTKESAIEEAKRLAKLHNKNFYVLESVCKVTYNGEVDDVIESEEHISVKRTMDNCVKKELKHWTKMDSDNESGAPLMTVDNKGQFDELLNAIYLML